MVWSRQNNGTGIRESRMYDRVSSDRKIARVGRIGLAFVPDLPRTVATK